MKKYVFIIFLFTFFIPRFEAYAQVTDSYKFSKENLLDQLLKANPEKFKSILENQKEYRVQIIYTQINRDNENKPHFTQYNYHVDPKNYFYPASLVKLPAVAMALEKINKLKSDSAKAYPKISSLNKETRLKIDSAYTCQSVVNNDSTSENGFPSIAQYIKKMLLVSDNDAYTHMYEFLGQEYANKNLLSKGYTSARIIHRFKVCDTLENRYTNPFVFLNDNEDTIYKQRMQFNSKQLTNYLGGVKIGKKNIEKGKLVNRPKEFTYYNYICLQDMNDILISVMFPQSVKEKKRFQLTQDDYHFLWKYMSMYPRESDYPKYDSINYWDCYKKYLLYGNSKDSTPDKNIRIFNVVGQSYGFLSDVAYIVDYKNKIEFALSAVIYVNSDGIINDGKYDYDTVGFPFLGDVGRVIYEYEKQRKRLATPDLSQFKMDY